ncbi:MAG TPA: hypothetical protein VKB51_01075 [bacterium]|nr:hypothetical protein [bacterium]
MPPLGPRFTRRTLLRAGAGASLAAALGTTVLPREAQAIDWEGLFSKRMPNEGGKVKELVGQASANGKALRVGDKVASGALVKVAPGGRCVVSLEDGSIFTVFGGSTLELLLSEMSAGVLNLVAGALLLVVNTGGRYLVAGSTASFGIKGTVVYRQVFSPEQHTGQSMDGLVQIPTGFSDYFCTCHGQVEWLLSGRNTPYAQTNAQHHDAYYVNPADPTVRLHAPMLNHNDEEIRRLVDMQEGTKHEISWLRS